jgi:tetratricopeptide (TPR) repeat protein
MDLPEKELLSNLSSLKDSELLYERGIYPQSSYIFKHALTREVVYDSILTGRKKKLHEEIGNAIEEWYKDSLREHYEVLAEHYVLSENYPKCAEYSRLAGRKAEKTASLNDAIAHAKKRVASIERVPRTKDVERKIIDARVTMGLYLSQMNYHVEAKETVDPITDLAVKHDYKKRLCQIYTIIGAHHFAVEENYADAFQVLKVALKISEEAKDIVASLLASVWLGCVSGWNCEFERSEYYFQKALKINMEANNLWGIAAIKSLLSYYCYYYPGKMNLSFNTTMEALRTAEESGDIYSKVATYVSHGFSCIGKGFLEEAEKHLLSGVEFCERIKLHSWNANARNPLGEIYFEMKDFQRSKEHYERGISLLENSQSFPSWAGLERVGLARSKVMNKEKDVNLESLQIHFRNNRLKVLEGWIQRNIGEIFLNVDDQHFSEAEHWIRGAIEADRRNGMMLNLGRDHALCAELFKRKGDRSKFQEHLGKAIDLFKECGADGWLKKAEEGLATFT